MIKPLFENRYFPAGVFLICLIFFIGMKVPHLSLPFFWDESGVYGKMVFQLSDSRLSMHPGAIDEWTSRGHPLLYPNLIAAACKVFGESVTVAHTANFLLACLLLLSVFFHLSKAFNPWTGLLAGVLVMIQPIFFTQSVFVLPEIALTLFLWWSSWAFITKKYWLYFLSGSAAVLTKEPAIIWLGALCLWDLLRLKKGSWWSILLWITPLMTFGFFLLAQKKVLGWYFFPSHSSGFDFRPNVLLDKLIFYITYLFWEEGRYLLLVIVGIAIIQLYKRNRKGLKFDVPPEKARYVSILFAAGVYLFFCITTFHTQRYILPVLVPLCAALAYLMVNIVAPGRYILLLVSLILMTFISFRYFMSAEVFNYDSDMSYVRSIESSKKTVHYLLDQGMLEQGEFTVTMPVLYALHDERFGYLPPGVSPRYSQPIKAGTKYAIKISPGTDIENPENFPLELIMEWYDHDIKTSIYKVLPADTSGIQN